MQEMQHVSIRHRILQHSFIRPIVLLAPKSGGLLHRCLLILPQSDLIPRFAIGARNQHLNSQTQAQTHLPHTGSQTPLLSVVRVIRIPLFL